MPRIREEKHFASLLIWRKIIQNCLIHMIMIYYCDKKPKDYHILEADIITINKKTCSKDTFFFTERIPNASVLNHFHINGLDLF